MSWNKYEWIKAFHQNPDLILPLCPFPFIKLTGGTVEEVLKSSEKQVEVFRLMDEHPQMGAVVTFMDLSIEAEQFGSPIRFSDIEAPSVERPIIDEESSLDELHPEVKSKRMLTNIDAIRKAATELKKPIIAGAIGPFSLAGRLMELSELMIQCFIDPDRVHQLIKTVTELILSYIKELKKAGAKGVIMAEPAAGLLDPDSFSKFSNHYVRKICDEVCSEEFLFIYHNCGPIMPLLSEIVQIKADGFHFGNAVELDKVIVSVPKDRLVLGNIDPVGVLNKMNSAEIKEQTKILLKKMEKYPNYICSTGCDVPFYTPIENINALFEAVEEYNEHN